MRTTTLLKAIDPVDMSEVERISESPLFAELRQDIMATQPQIAVSAATPARTRPQRTRLTVLLGITAAIVLMAGLLVLPLPNNHTVAAPHAGAWRLADDQLTGTWQQFESGPPPGTLSCPTASTCYALSGRFNSPMAGAPMLSESLYVSSNAGSSWSARPMPQGFASTSSVACGGPQMCAAGGTDAGQNVLAATSNGGETWIISPLPNGTGHLDTLSCPTADFCTGLAADSEFLQIGTTSATFLSSSDGGKSFTDHPIVEGDSMESLSCASSLDCTAIGWDNAQGPNNLGAGVAAFTTDGGQTWTPSTLPIGLGVDSNSAISCSDALHCSLLGQVVIPQRDLPECPKNPAIPPTGPQSTTVQDFAQAEAQAAMNEKQTFQCPTSGNSPVVVEAIASSDDGGASWTLASLPSSLPQPYFSDISCPTTNECWATGEAAVPRQVGTVYNEGSPILIGTTDGGATWSKVTFSVPTSAPDYDGQSYFSMGWISCPTSATCVALGTAAQGAPNVPAYNLGVSGPGS